MKEYNSILLEDNEVEFLLDITQLTGEIFRAVPFPGDIDTAIENYQFESNETFWYESNHIIMLYFSDSTFEALPQSIGNLSNLRFLIINGCQIQQIPSSFKNLHELEGLVFYNDAGDEEQPVINIDFPDIFKNLKNLKIFEIDGHFNIYFPPSFMELQNLEELTLRYCLYSPNRSNYKKNSKLDIFNPECETQFIFELPDDLSKIKTLKKLTIKNSRVKHLPESLTNLHFLIELDLENTDEINNLEIVFNIKSLEKLKSTHCKIKTLPKTIGNLTNLKTLNLSWNDLQEIPSEITRCKQLEIINLYMNRFDQELECLKFLPNLKLIVINKPRQNIIPKEIRDKIDIKVIG